MQSIQRVLVLESISEQIPAVIPEFASFFKVNCMVCFYSQGHNSGVTLEMHYIDHIDYVKVLWDGEVTPQHERACQDERKTTDYGACALALLYIREFTEFTAFEVSAFGSTVDYELIHKNDIESAINDDTYIFKYTKAYLEVSGIRTEAKDNTVSGRVQEKVTRLRKPQELPTFIAVSDFSKPWAKVVLV